MFYVTFSHLVFLLLELTISSRFLLNIVWPSSFYFGLCIIAFLAMRADKITVTLFSRKNLIHSLPVLVSLIVGEAIIFALGGSEYQSVDIVTILFLPVTVFSEEYVFRGYFQNIIRRNYNWYVSLFLTNIMFALSHVPLEIINLEPLGRTIVFLCSRFLGGSFFSLTYLVSENLLLPILIHSFYNLTVLYFPAVPTFTLIFFIWIMPLSITFLLYRSRLKK